MMGLSGCLRHHAPTPNVQTAVQPKHRYLGQSAGKASRTCRERVHRPRRTVLGRAQNVPDNSNGTGHKQRRSVGADYPAGAATPPSEPVVTIVTGEDGRPMAVAIATMGDGVAATTPPAPPPAPVQIPTASVVSNSTSSDVVKPTAAAVSKTSPTANAQQLFDNEPVAVSPPSVVVSELPQAAEVVAPEETPVAEPLSVPTGASSRPAELPVPSPVTSAATDAEPSAPPPEPVTGQLKAAVPEPSFASIVSENSGLADTSSVQRTSTTDQVNGSSAQALPETALAASSSTDTESEPVPPASSSAEPPALPIVANETGVADRQQLPEPSSPGISKEAKRLARLERYKVQLLTAVASLDRGLAANVQEAKDVDDIAQKLEVVGGDVQLNWNATTSGRASMEQLIGTWRLIYSSGFNTGSLGGTRPGPPAAVVPAILGQVYQRIDAEKGKLDNIVEFLLNYNLPSLPLISSPERESPAIRLTLGHDYSVLGENTLEIVYEDTGVQLLGSSIFAQLPALELPQVPEVLKPPKFLRSATFNVTYLDDMMRVTRGDRGELRIYLKDQDLEVAIPEDEDA